MAAPAHRVSGGLSVARHVLPTASPPTRVAAEPFRPRLLHPCHLRQKSLGDPARSNRDAVSCARHVPVAIRAYPRAGWPAHPRPRSACEFGLLRPIANARRWGQPLQPLLRGALPRDAAQALLAHTPANCLGTGRALLCPFPP